MNKNQKRILILEYLTIAWNIVEGAVAVTIGLLTGSVSLFAFGLESGIEVFSSSVTVWDIKGVGNGRRKKALKLIGVAFIVVSIYITFSALHSIIDKNHSEPTIWSIVYMSTVSVMMFILGYMKRNLGKKMNNPVVLAEANFTFMDVALSISILAGLVLNMLLDWWWVDQILALIIAGNAFFQGIKGLADCKIEQQEKYILATK